MKKVFIVLLSFALFGCGVTVTHMKTVNNKPAVNLLDNQSAIIFIRATNSGGAISSPIAEYKDGDATFIGNMKGACKILHITTPGKHEYVVPSTETSYVLKADLKGGMYYYVYITPRLGWVAARFRFKPVDPLHEKDNLAKYINSNSIPWIENTKNGFEWFEANKQSFITKFERADGESKFSVLNKDAGTTTLIK